MIETPKFVVYKSFEILKVQTIEWETEQIVKTEKIVLCLSDTLEAGGWGVGVVII